MDANAEPLEDGTPQGKAKPPAGESPLRRMARDVKGAEGVGGRWVDLVFGPRRSADQRVIVFHHLRKTAGTSLKVTIERNVPSARCVRVLYPDGSREEIGAWWAELFASLTASERASLWAVSSHTAGFALPHLAPHVAAITMVRDPIDQTLSRWFMRKSSRDTAQGEGLDGLRDLYERGARKDMLYNSQARTLLEPHFDVSRLPATLGPPADANLWRERLFSLLGRHFLVGVQGAFDDSLRMFADELGWVELEAETAKVNQYRPRELRLDADIADMLEAANWLDWELYNEYAPAFGALQRTRREEATGRLAHRATGYLLERPVPDDPIEALRAELDVVRADLGAEAQSLRLRLRAAELEIRRLRADPGRAAKRPKPADPKKPPKEPAASTPGEDFAERERLRKLRARRKVVENMRSGR